MDPTEVYAALIQVYKDHNKKDGMLRIVKSSIEYHLENPEDVDFKSLLKRIKEVLDIQ